jgi:hypothetical protein
MRKSFNLRRHLTQFLTAEQDLLAKSEKENKGQTESNFQMDQIYETRRQILFYNKLISSLKQNKDIYNKLVKYSFRLWELQRTNQPSSYPFMTFQPSSKNGELFSENSDAVFISPEEIESKIGQTTKEETTPIPDNNVCPFYSVDPKKHTLLLLKTYTFTNQGRKRGLHITEEQYNAILNKRVVPQFELWRMWPLFSIKQIETIVTTSKKSQCDADDMIESNQSINKAIAETNKCLADVNKTLQESD